MTTVRFVTNLDLNSKEHFDADKLEDIPVVGDRILSSYEWPSKERLELQVIARVWDRGICIIQLHLPTYWEGLLYFNRWYNKIQNKE